MPRKKRAQPFSRSPLPLPASLPNLHPLLMLAAAHVFDTLRVGVSLRAADEWYAIHVPTQPSMFEIAHGHGMERNDYNEHCLTLAWNERRAILGEHAGFSDYFVPIHSSGKVHAVLVTGPFSVRRPTSDELVERWAWITGRRAHPSDPEFAHYVSMVLDTLLLEGEQLSRFGRMLGILASMAAARGDARVLAAEAAALRRELERTRFVDRMWEEARSMVDERGGSVWLSPHKANDLTFLGLSELPEQVLVGLVAPRFESPDPIDELLRRDAFQRAAVELGRSAGNTAVGRVGEHGVMFLCAGRGRGPRAARALADLGRRASELARTRFGFALHVGTSALDKSTSPLNVRYAEALAAAEQAVSQGVGSVVATVKAKPSASPIRYLREQVGTASDEQRRALAAKFEHFAELVVIYSGYRSDLVRAQLEAGLVQVAYELRSNGLLDSKGYQELLDTLDSEARAAPNVSELIATYRRAIGDLVHTAEQPVDAAHERSLRRAVTFIHRHFAESINLSQVARVAGFAPRYFSRLFKEREKTTFEDYVRRLRIEHAKQLLSATELGTQRIAELSGFRFRPYFHRVFKQLTGVTPAHFRGALPMTANSGA